MTTAGGGWTMVLDQNVAVSPSVQTKAAWTAGVNTSSPNAGQYSILNRLAALKAGANYELWLNWPSSSAYIRWSQVQNPFSVTSGAAVTLVGTPTSVPANQTGGTSAPFTGLYSTSVSPAVSATTLAGDLNPGYYWFAVGLTATYNGGIPAYSGSASGQLIASRTQLFVR